MTPAGRRFGPSGSTARSNLDGALDERSTRRCRRSPSSSRSSPTREQPATEKTEVWVFFDDDNVYVAARAVGTAPESGGRQRDAPRQHQHPAERRHVAFAFDTFYDRRNGVVLRRQRRSAGAIDGQITNERQFNGDWNPIWDVAVGPLRRRLDGRSARFRSSRCAIGPGAAQIWGFNARRMNRWKNEIVVSDPHSAGRWRRRGIFAGVAGGDAGRARGAAGSSERSRSSRTRSRI